jgi:acyl dehydratase
MAVRFEDLQEGQEVFTVSKVVKREDVKAYADASGDQNPLHQDDTFARSVGFPGIIAHGMFSMAHLTNAITGWAGDPGAFRRIKVQFRAPVFMDETLVAKGRVKSLDPGTKTVVLDVSAQVDRAGDIQWAIKNGEAVVQLD